VEVVLAVRLAVDLDHGRDVQVGPALVVVLVVGEVRELLDGRELVRDVDEHLAEQRRLRPVLLLLDRLQLRLELREPLPCQPGPGAVHHASCCGSAMPCLAILASSRIGSLHMGPPCEHRSSISRSALSAAPSLPEAYCFRRTWSSWLAIQCLMSPCRWRPTQSWASRSAARSSSAV